ncbi:uncharacterized protein LOC128209214 [Mya arenaria]|uniref:uncharacterized protein LOC128209214 n=1 Tax=Mya arenaria TaxID=6604 RepID=UPI0022E4246B|nr:uncharacterized protein LOC128209214 [Mya arenaria]
MATRKFKLTLRVSGREDGRPVHFKQDGQRFEHAHTVKLNASTDYEMKFTIKPAIHIDKLMINGELHKMEVCGLGEEADAADGRTYTTTFTTVGIEQCKSGKRREVLIVLELENGVYMKVILQCKLYPVGETSHASWGNTLNAFEIDCSLTTAHNYVTVTKEKYL